jgi:two-component system, chemotaxis family, protein-glutamate methylesterase/glutaminase
MTTPTAAVTATEEKIRVMVVDDSVVVRGFISRILLSEPRIEITAAGHNGKMAVPLAERNRPDVIILDIEMPELDGLAALPLLRAASPQTRIIMSSTLTQRNAEISLQALALGATDYIAKPNAHEIGRAEEYHRELLEKILGLGVQALHERPQPPAQVTTAVRRGGGLYPGASVALRRAAKVRPKAMVIGSSTGGPPALTKLFETLPADVGVPILIAQHMPATFTAVLAQHIGKAANRPCTEAKEGDTAEPGHIYVAPGDWHLEFAGGGDRPQLHLTKAPPENYCRPSVNPLFRSAAKAYGAGVLAVILTGMGCDGLDGARDLAAVGAPLIAQDEKTSVVWGMPGAVATAGLCTAVAPLDDISRVIGIVFSEGRT